MFNRIRPALAWTNGSVIPGSQLEQFDENQSNAIDGLNAGAYSLQFDLEFGGAPGVEFILSLPVTFYDDVYFAPSGEFGVGGPATFYNNVLFQQDVQVNGALNVDGAADFQSDVGIAGILSAYGDSYYDGAAHFNGDMECIGPAEFQSDVGIAGILSAYGDSYFDGTAHFNGLAAFTGGASFTDGVEFTKPIGFSGTGKIKFRSKTLTVKGAQSVVAANYDTVYVPPALIDDGDVITISDAGAEDGMRIRFTHDDTAARLGIQTPSGAMLYLKNASGWTADTELERIGGTWRFQNVAKG